MIICPPLGPRSRTTAGWSRPTLRRPRGTAGRSEPRDPRRAAMALRLAVTADPDFALAAADLEAITGTPGRHPGRRPMNWERHHIEVVTAAAAGHVTRASDLLREHLASVGCDPLAVRITARLREPMARTTTWTSWPASFPAATPPRGRAPPDALAFRFIGICLAREDRKRCVRTFSNRYRRSMTSSMLHNKRLVLRWSWLPRSLIERLAGSSEQDGAC